MCTGLRLLQVVIVCLLAALLCNGQGIITTIAGTEPTYPGSSFSALSASFGELSGVAVSPSGDVYFASASRSLVVKFNPTLNSLSIVAGIGIGGYSGDGGPAIGAALNFPQQLAFDQAGNLYIADQENNAIRRIDTQGIITTVAWLPNSPNGLAIASDGTLYASTYAQILQIKTNGTVTVIAGGNQQGYAGDGGPANKASLDFPQGLLFDYAGNLLVADTSNHRVRRIDTTGKITTIAGNGQTGTAVAGPAISTSVSYPIGLSVDVQGNIYFGAGTNQLMRVDPNGVLSILNPNNSNRFLTTPGPVSQATVNPAWLAFDQANNLYFTDVNVNCLYKLSATGTIQAVAAYSPNFAIGDNGTAVLAGLNFPNGIWLAPDGPLLIADEYNQRIRRLSPSGSITTAVGKLPRVSRFGTCLVRKHP